MTVRQGGTGKEGGGRGVILDNLDHLTQECYQITILRTSSSLMLRMYVHASHVTYEQKYAHIVIYMCTYTRKAFSMAW